MLSDALHEYGEKVTDEVLQVLVFGCLSTEHAGQFKAFVKQLRSKFKLKAILGGDSNLAGRTAIQILARFPSPNSE